jgi:hypothetical protein
MKQVHKHPDGLIYVRTDYGIYGDTVENFYKDFGVEFPPLPQGATECIYDVGKRHAINKEGDTIAGGPMPWDFGDQLIANVQTGLNAQEARKAVELEAWRAEMRKKEEALRKDKL